MPPLVAQRASVRRSMEELVLAILVARRAAMSIAQIREALERRWSGGAPAPVTLVAPALRRLEAARKVENLGRAIGWRAAGGK